ncbi:MAG TPA: universal stress protein [Burkholderiales bacterium]|jgi:nucleotide-binding universal stress UspA family protein
MFRHILLPIDDSPVSRKAARKAIAFAKEIGARITGYHALPSAHNIYGDGYRFPPSGSLKKDVREARAHFIEGTARAALDAGVRFDSLVDRAITPDEGIVEAARTRNCDVIFIGTNGRRGLARLALGSVTSKVLTRAGVPVLVYR